MSSRPGEALQQVEPDWSPARAASGWQRLESTLRRQRRRRAALAFTAAAGIAGALAIWIGRAAPPSPPPSEAQLTFLDGTTARATLPATELRVAEDTPSRQVVQIVRGGARFEVAPVAGRTFRVQLHTVAVEVLGTVFRVEEAGERVRVAVERGRVRVQHGAERRELGPGQSLEISPPAPPAATIPRSLPSAASPTPRHRPTPDGLLAAADRARRAGQPHLAMRQLRRLVAQFPTDDQAPLAAFTLGLVALERRRPQEAARAFALARRLAPAGELAEDALAREVQAWSEAGEARTAGERAREYDRLYPAGRRRGSVRRFGGLR